MNTKTVNYNIFIYSDSTAFPRLNQLPNRCWPQILKDLLERSEGTRVHLFFRGKAAAPISELHSIYERDNAYFGKGEAGSIDLTIFSFGIVDCAPRPFTYLLKKYVHNKYFGRFLNKIISKYLNPHRTFLQKIYSYRLTPDKKFQLIYNGMVDFAVNKNTTCISIDTPLTPVEMEDRSPGLRNSIITYNNIKNANGKAMHLNTDSFQQEHFLEDGHHFTELGHKFMAQNVHELILKVVRNKNNES